MLPKRLIVLLMSLCTLCGAASAVQPRTDLTPVSYTHLLARLTAKGAKSKSAKYRKDKRDAVAERMNEEFEREEMERSTLKVTEFVTVSELATMMNVTPTRCV